MDFNIDELSDAELLEHGLLKKQAVDDLMFKAQSTVDLGEAVIKEVSLGSGKDRMLNADSKMTPAAQLKRSFNQHFVERRGNLDQQDTREPGWKSSEGSGGAPTISDKKFYDDPEHRKGRKEEISDSIAAMKERLMKDEN